MRGVRGAITVKQNSKNAIFNAAKKLIKEIFNRNQINIDNVISIIFTATPDLNSAYPAAAVREMGYDQIPLMCYQEMDVINSLKKCIRCMVYINNDISLSNISHVYLKKAQKLRPDLVENSTSNNKNSYNSTKNTDFSHQTNSYPEQNHINQNNIISLDNDIKIGDKSVTLMAGPCAVENREQILKIAEIVKRAGAQFLRGGAYKPRTSPYSFQGLKKDGLKLLSEAREKTGLKIITEVMDPRHVELVGQHTDIFQIGSRNMQNFYLLKEVGKTNKPVMLKRGMNATYKEFLLAAEYIKAEGNEKIILCERGIKTFEDYTRYTLDLVSIPVLKKLSNYPIIVDPSHGTGHRDLIIPAAKGAISMGVDGLIIEVHHNPEEALSDGRQSLKPEMLLDLVKEIKPLVELNQRKL